MIQDMEKAVKRDVILDMSNEDYHAHDSLSSSQLKLAYRNIELFKRSVLDGDIEHKTSAAFKIGTLFHEMILEPEKFSPVVYPHEKIDKRTKEYKQFASLNDPEDILSLSEFDKLEAMKSSLLSHSHCPDFSKTVNESSVFYSWKDFDLRVRPDALDIESQTIFDVKTTSSPVNKQEFLFHLQKYDYDLSAAMYIHALSCHHKLPFSFCFVVVQTVEPYTSAMYYLGEGLYHQGFSKYKKALKRIQYCKDVGAYKFQEKSEVLDTRRPVEKSGASSYYKANNHLSLGGQG